MRGFARTRGLNGRHAIVG